MYRVRGAAPPIGTAPRSGTFRRFPGRNPYKPLWVRIAYIGGPNGEWEMITREHRWVADWGAALGDILQWLNGSHLDGLGVDVEDR